MSENIYSRLGATPIINAAGNSTAMGGATPTPIVKQAMEEAEEHFVDMEELLEKSGDHIASLVGAEAAYVTAGCYAAMVLSTAACMTGNDQAKMDQLPDTTGMKDEVILQAKQRYGFDRAYTIPGSKLVIAGDESGCTPEQLEAAIGPQTAAVIHFVSPDPDVTVVSLEDTVRIAHKHNVYVIADAASQIFPIDYFQDTAISADLVCFGGKYVHGPHSAGFVAGKKDLIQAVAAHGFIGPRPLGRGMKIDRQEIIGLTVALDQWFTMDHEERFDEYRKKFAVIERAIEGAPGVEETKEATTPRYWGVELHVVVNAAEAARSARELIEALDAGDPCIKVGGEDEDTVVVRVDNLEEGDEHTIAQRLRALLAG
jgi:L-seryl-tRNA(Ser) seleniumtransferase